MLPAVEQMDLCYFYIKISIHLLTVDACTGLSGKKERGGGERRLDALILSGLLLFSLDSGRDACI